MKSAISMPDALFERVAETARSMGVSRSAFLATAASKYLDDLTDDGVTEQLNAAIEAAGAPVDDWTMGARSALARHLGDDEW